jgi:hypothetical protein
VAELYNAKCLSCQHSWLQSEGGGFAFFQMVCATCGHSHCQPRTAPKNSDAPMTRTQLRQYLSGGDAPWEHAGRPFTEVEQARIDDMYSHCGCGGNFYPGGHKRARLRCPECKSSDVQRGQTQLMAD